MSTRARQIGIAKAPAKAVEPAAQRTPEQCREPLLRDGPLAAIQRLQLNPAHVLSLNNSIGNHAVGKLLQVPGSPAPRIQAKLMINKPGDEFEVEADRVAEQVVRMPAGQRQIQRKAEKPEILTKPASAPVAGGAVEADETFARQLQGAHGQGQSLPAQLRTDLEGKFGADFSQVRIHATPQSARMTEAIQAHAFTHGQDIYFGSGQFDVESLAGKRLLAHELTHVVQQNRVRQGNVHTIPGFPIQRQTRWSLTPTAPDAPAGGPREHYTYQDIYDLKQRWEDAALQVARQVVRPGDDRDELIHAIKSRRRRITQTPGSTSIAGQLQAGNVGPASLLHAHPEEQVFMRQVVKNQYQFELAELIHLYVLKQPGYVGESAKTGPTKYEIMDAIKDAYVASLNDRTEWGIISREMELADESTVVNTMTPVNEYYDQETFGGYGTTGWASMARNLPIDAGHGRTTNLWHSKMTTSDGKPIFEAFRSGSIGAKGVGTEDEQVQFSEDKAHGLLQAAAINLLRAEHPKRKQQWAKHQASLLKSSRTLRRTKPVNFGTEAPLQVDMVSISLQTRSPGYVGPKHFGPFDEKIDVQLQNAALMSWHGKEETFAGLEGLPPRTVRYNVIFFNTGVNAAADMLGHKQDAINEVAMESFERAYEKWHHTASVAAMSASSHGDEANAHELRAKLAMAGMLRQQINDEWKWALGFKDYKLPAMIANLACLMGHTVQYNCKSGKDRTSVMDIESKFMALRIRNWIANTKKEDISPYLTHYAPRVNEGDRVEVYEFTSREDKDDYRKLLVEAGNLELQKLNTGSKGYKIIPKPWAESHVTKRIGDVADLVLGLTRTVEVKGRYEKGDFPH
jgi:hypothetical protein